MTTLLLARHGETVDNVNHIMQGQTHGMLTANGISQAEELAARMAEVHIDAFLSSDLQRSIDTCRIIAKPHGMEVVTTPLLRERDWGAFTGQYIPDLQDKPWPPDVETLGMLKERALRFLRMVVENHPGQTVLAVGHGIINKAIQSVFYDKPMHEVPRMNNAEVRKLVLRNQADFHNHREQRLLRHT